jgi:hypothetical protein
LLKSGIKTSTKVYGVSVKIELRSPKRIIRVYLRASAVVFSLVSLVGDHREANKRIEKLSRSSFRASATPRFSP